MTRLIVPSSLRTQLQGLDSELELCDESGRTLGYFVPSALDERALYDRIRSEFTDEEIEAARRQPGGRTTAEVLECLGRS
jgi:hypothetical protein